ncbi:MAG TPA: phenylalanine--tRNA ligase subunit alpha [Ilumatobacteraceae bacterium]|nr:phenylalanine--tRNA ligase subunit alpha [Ilumatobacteraceae bacterium]
MIEEVKRAGDDALARVAQASTADEVRTLEAELLGKRGPFATFKSGLAALATVDDKRAAGQVLNDATAAVADGLDRRRRELAAAERLLQLAAERVDLTEVLTRPRRGHAHVVTQAWERLEDVFIGLGFQVAEGPDVETDWYNFEALNLPPDHPARSMHDTFYVEHGEPGSTVLRTHTSPVQIRVMQTVPPPIYMIMPGRVFRNETTDATHLAVFHQLEGLVVDRGITLADLAGTIDSFTKAFFGSDFGSRLRPSYFPFTEPSAEFDIQTPSGQWLELGGCGMVHPNVLRAGGLDPEEWSGFAFGFGIDRMAKERHAIGDVREMFSNDLRFLEQF